ncbi:hypothetical protein [Alistipes sp.]|uniref:hypothetical protein n=1 Tax=Alistipes sp. TaxID=1872444 RepID=UPI0011CB7F12
MKNFRHYALLSVSALCMLCASCSDDDTATQQAPTVTFGPDRQVTATSITFTVVSAHADIAAYLLVRREAETPTAADVMKDGKPLPGEGTTRVTEENLASGVDYTVYAAARRGDLIGDVVTFGFTTGTSAYDDLLTLTDTGKNFISYHIEVEPETTFRHVALLKKVVENFTDGTQSEQEYAQRIQLLLSIYGMPGTGPLDYTLHDLDLRPNGQPYDVMAGMSYQVMACRTDASGNYVGDYQLIDTRTPDPADNGLTVGIEILDLQATEMTVRYTPDEGLRYIIEQPLPKSMIDGLLAEGGKDALLEQLFISSPRMTEFTEPSEWTYLDPETEYIHYVIGVDERGDRTALLEKPFTTPEEQEVDVNTENLAFAHAILASYYGMSEDDDGNTVHNFYILVADQNMLPDEYGDPYPVAFPCHALNCDFYAATRGGDELTLAEGTYTFSDTSAAGTWSSYDSWAAYFDEQEEMYEFSFGGGTITVAHEGTDYRLTFDLTTEKGKAYTGTYTGPITFEDYSFSPFAIGKSRWAAPRAPHGSRTPLR